MSEAVSTADPSFPHIVCIGASAGGLEALTELYTRLPPSLGIPFVVVLHLSPDFKSLMPELLSKHTSMTVKSADDDERLEPDHVYIIPPGKNMIMAEGRLRLQSQDRTPGHALHLPVDLFFQSAAQDMGERAIALILSGTGSDGAQGTRAIKEQEGVVLVQSPHEAKFDGMPLSALQTGSADETAPIADLARTLVGFVRRGQPPAGDELGPGLNDLSLVQAMLFQEGGSELKYLRPQMLQRRVQRRLDLLDVPSIDMYVERLRSDPDELKRLRQDLLISVTSFFRDRPVFDAIETSVVPAILASANQESIRVWVPACATGQEAYSLAILILEGMEARGVERELRLFATDIDDRGLEHASQGRYGIGEITPIPGPLLAKYFVQSGQHFIVTPKLRQRIIFARHNVVIDPPFGRMDLVSCRNLLIYLQPEGQRRVLHSLYQALRPDTGILVLGDCETAHPLEASLLPLDEKARIYARRGPPPKTTWGPEALTEPPVRARIAQLRDVPPAASSQGWGQLTLLRSILERTFELENRSAALIDRDHRLQEVITDPLGIFRFPKGRPTDDLDKILPSALFSALLALRQPLAQTEAPAGQRLVVPGFDERWYELATVAIGNDGLTDADTTLLAIRLCPSPPEEAAVEAVGPTAERQLAGLRHELRQTKENLQATIEELQSSNQEQQSTNEELLASNEELQSTNEELKSANQELYTVNTEYQKKNAELEVATADLDNLLRSISVASLYLDAELNIRRFTPLMTKLIPLKETDIGHPIAAFRHHLDVDFVEEVEAALASEQAVEREVRDRRGSWHVMLVAPYRRAAGTAEGALFTFTDVTQIKNAEAAARMMAEQLSTSNDKLLSQTTQLEDLLSIVAHDLKRPVLGLDGMLKLAERSFDGGQLDDGRHLLSRGIASLEQLRALLRDLTNIAQLHQVTTTPEPVDLQPWLDEVMTPFVERAESSGVRLQYSCDRGRLMLPRASVTGVIVNLVENAFVHGASGPEPRIDVHCHVVDHRLRIVIADNGQGIAPQNHERVFEMFRRLQPESTPGTGVGLVAVRRLASRAGGVVKLDSALNEGCRFTFELPLADLPPDNPQVPISGPLLLVEDDEVDAKHVHKILNGRAIDWVKTKREAERRLEEQRFALILLDLSLPDGHGLGVIPTARQGFNAHTPIVVFSGHTQGLEGEALEALTVDATISKDSIVGEVLPNIVKGLLREDA